MQAVILSAGRGTRLLPLTLTRAKHLIPIANRPIIAYVFDLCRALQATDVTIVVNPPASAAVEALAPHAAGLRLRATPQPQARGLADATRAAAATVVDDRFLLMLGDTIIVREALPAIRSALAAPGYGVFLTRVADPRQYGVAEVADGKVQRLLEKPEQPPSNLALMGLYLLPHAIFAAIDRIAPSPRGELEITDAIDRLVQDGLPIQAYELPGGWVDAGDPPGLLAANRWALDAAAEAAVEAEAGIMIHPTAVVEGCELSRPVAIAAGAELRGCRIGPYAAIGEGCRAEDSTLGDCILLDGAHLQSSTAQRSVVGAGAVVRQTALDGRIVGDGQQLSGR